MLKRALDILFSLAGLLLLSPFLILISTLLFVSSKGGVFYFQKRVGRNAVDFTLYKFRTMRPGAEKQGLLTVGGRDPRITAVGYYLRKFKLDELPQLINVLIGDMSVVGPRPEVREYVNLYTEEQKKILLFRPGLTDYASLEYFNENELLAKSPNPKQTYIKEIMPAKLQLNQKYIREQSVITDLKIILSTIGLIFKRA